MKYEVVPVDAELSNNTKTRQLYRIMRFSGAIDLDKSKRYCRGFESAQSILKFQYRGSVHI